MRFLHSKLNDDVCHLIYTYTDNYREYFRKEVLTVMVKIVRDNMIKKMWHIMYCSGRSTMEGMRNLKEYLKSDAFDLENLRYHPDFYFIDKLYFNHAIMKHLIKTRPLPLHFLPLPNH